ncbi:MAG: cytidylate kinase-like family protein [bacterium]|nr:cytidylate kinase-like family protein [bacterium]
MPWKLSSDSRISAQALERQMKNWELSRLQRLGNAATVQQEVEDFITISRQVGIASEDLAQSLGSQLGWPVFGRGLLEAMAGDDDVRRRIYHSMDERDLRWWEEALRSLVERDFDVNDYFHRLSHTVLSLARQSSCIFVGRGCDLMLPRTLGLRVRLVAPLQQRIESLAENLGLGAAAARRELNRIESDRAEFLNHHFRAQAEDPTRADLTVNLDRWEPQAAIELILAARAMRSEARALQP